MEATAFAPGHITGFFQIRDETVSSKEKGSVGAGICISKGVVSRVEVVDVLPHGRAGRDNQHIDIYLNGVKSEAAPSRLAIKKLIGDSPYDVTVWSEVQLPVRQGFGLSGAGALSSALAVAEALGSEVTYEDVVCAAHEAEVELKTGLGDVVAQGTGGVPIRVRPGAPPYGQVKRLDALEIDTQGPKIVLCVVDTGIDTKTVLSDPACRAMINKFGRRYLNSYLPTPHSIIYLNIHTSLRRKQRLLTKRCYRQSNPHAVMG